jgi:N-acetylmuramoyl-L-alanine amidase
LVIDLYDIGRAPEIQPSIQMPSPTSGSDKRDIIVAIDAGHGGEDPGALSYNRKIREKDVALAIARAIFNRLSATPGYHPVMVRDGDYSVQLQKRPQIAREKRADIFLSIHADSFRTSRAEGITVYALSEKIAEDENARRVAQKENSANLLGGVAGDTSLRDVEDDLARTLLDLSMAWSIEQSISAASYILDSLGSVARLRRDKAQQGNLWVLRSPDIPSLLIETGYLSNPSEAEKLNTPSYQRRLADGVVLGVMSYFYATPPQNTLIAWQKSNGIKPDFGEESGGGYKVQRGDSLSLIAQRSGISTSELKSLNGLRSNVIRVGQELTLPGLAAFSTPAIEHTTKRGETLSGIAQRYGVSLSSIRSENNLRRDSIQVGQVLKIPTR